MSAPGAAPVRRGRLVIPWLLGVLMVGSTVLTAWYASHGLHSDRYWDERFSMQNVAALLLGDSFRPANGYYQSLSYLPQSAVLAGSEALHRWTGWEPLAIFDEERRFTATAYLLVRLVQVVYGVLCLHVTFLLGRRLFGPGVGLLGAFLLAVTPWHVQASSMYKPDVLLTLGVLLSTWWSLRAGERPGAGRFAIAGGGVALAASAKLNGFLAGVPLAVAAVLSGGAWWRRGARLALGAAVCAGLFVLLNPWFSLYTEAFGRNLEHYTYKAGTYSGTRLGVLWREAELIASRTVHGRILGALALGSGAVLAWRLLRRSLGGGHDGELGPRDGWSFLSFPLAYSIAYAALTPHFKDNNFLPVFPFTALLGAWGASRLWRLAAGYVPTLRRPAALAAAVTLLVVALTPRPALYAYRHAVPTTEELAWRFLRARFRAAGEAEARLVFAETGGDAEGKLLVPPSLPDLRVAGVATDRLGALDPARLDAADGEIFPAERLQGEEADAYWERLAAGPRGAVRRVAGEAFAARGPDRIAVAHPWRRIGPALPGEVRPAPPGEGGGWLLDWPPGLDPGDRVSVLVIGRGLGYRPRLEIGGRPVDLVPVQDSVPGGVPRYVSERLAVDASARRLRVFAHAGAPAGAPPQVEVLRWRPPELRATP